MDDLRLFAHVPEETALPVENGVDDFGRERNVDTARQRRKVEREQRLRTFVELSGAETLIDQSLWSDDDVGQDWAAQRDAKLETIQTAKIEALLADVGEAFGSLSAVKARFESWKTDFPEDYANAFGSLSLPAAFEFYVRCELVAWDPFAEPIEFDAMAWHATLSEYGVDDTHEDADTELLNKVVEKIIVKKLLAMLDTLNVASSMEMRYCAQAVEQVSYYVEKHERAYEVKERPNLC